MWFRYHHVPSYGASPMFDKEYEEFSHGLNERTPVSNIRPAIDYHLVLVPELVKLGRSKGSGPPQGSFNIAAGETCLYTLPQLWTSSRKPRRCDG